MWPPSLQPFDCAFELVHQCVTSVAGYPPPKLSPRFCETVLVSEVVAGKGTGPQSLTRGSGPLLLLRQGNCSLAEDRSLPMATAKLHLHRHPAILPPRQDRSAEEEGAFGVG